MLKRYVLNLVVLLSGTCIFASHGSVLVNNDWRTDTVLEQTELTIGMKVTYKNHKNPLVVTGVVPVKYGAENFALIKHGDGTQEFFYGTQRATMMRSTPAWWLPILNEQVTLTRDNQRSIPSDLSNFTPDVSVGLPIIKRKVKDVRTDSSLSWYSWGAMGIVVTAIAIKICSHLKNKN